MNAEKVYNQFIEWVGKAWWKLPESEYLLPMIKASYTPEEAAFLTGIPLHSSTIDDLTDIKGMTRAELEPLLLELGRKGMIYKSRRGDSVRYRLNETFFALLRANFWSGKVDERIKSSAMAVNAYFLDNWFEQYNQVHHRGLRALPIDQTIQDDRTILPYEDVVKVLDSFEYYSVSTCPCRQRHNLDPAMKDCHHPLESCLHFDELGHYIVEHDMGREISKPETLDILKQSADSGLVHAISAWQEKPDTICNCCSCCCLFLESYHKLGHAKSLDASNYHVQVNPDSCKACGLCLKRCPMDALQMTYSSQAKNKFSKAVQVNLESCIGCGVCVHKCPTQSLALARNQEISPPPKTVRDYMQQYLKDRAEATMSNKQ